MSKMNSYVKGASAMMLFAGFIHPVKCPKLTMTRLQNQRKP